MSKETVSTASKNKTELLTCNTCKENKFQDERYGKNVRVMNSFNKGFRCTVCGKER